MSDMKTLDGIISGIHNVVGTDWNQPRSQLYIAATIHGMERGLKELQSQLDFERSVNKRVDEVVKGLLEAKLENREGSKAAT